MRCGQKNASEISSLQASTTGRLNWGLARAKLVPNDPIGYPQLDCKDRQRASGQDEHSTSEQLINFERELFRFFSGGKHPLIDISKARVES